MTDHGNSGLLLVASDFSSNAQLAADRGVQLAKQFGAKLRLLHVLDARALKALRALRPVVTNHTDPMREAAARALLHEAERLAPADPLGLATDLREGRVPEVIRTVARQLQVAWLILGAGGDASWRRWLLGSTAERMLQESACPLLVVRGTVAGPYRRGLVAVDFSSGSEAVIRQAMTLAPQAYWTLFHSYQVPLLDKLHLAGVGAAQIEAMRHDSQREAVSRLEAMAQAAGWLPGQYELVTEEADAGPSIVDRLRAHAYDLAVVGQRGHGAVAGLWLGSTSRHVVREARVDVAVVPALQISLD